MIPVLIETTAECAICGEIACERDLLYVETVEEADCLGCEVGETVCRECAGERP